MASRPVQTRTVRPVFPPRAKLGRRICGKDGLIAKRKAAKLQADARKFEKLKQRFEKTEITEPEKDKKETAKDGVVDWKPFKYEP